MKLSLSDRGMYNHPEPMVLSQLMNRIFPMVVYTHVQQLKMLVYNYLHPRKSSTVMYVGVIFHYNCTSIHNIAKFLFTKQLYSSSPRLLPYLSIYILTINTEMDSTTP